MLKTMILGVKTVVWSVSNSRMTAPMPHPMPGAVGGTMHTLQKGMSEAECLLVARLLKSGLECFAIYSHGPEAERAGGEGRARLLRGRLHGPRRAQLHARLPTWQMGFLYARVLQNNTRCRRCCSTSWPTRPSRAPSPTSCSPSSSSGSRRWALPRSRRPRCCSVSSSSSSARSPSSPRTSRCLAAPLDDRHAGHAPRQRSPRSRPTTSRCFARSSSRSAAESSSSSTRSFCRCCPRCCTASSAHAASHQPQVRELLLELCLTLPARLSSLLPLPAHPDAAGAPVAARLQPLSPSRCARSSFGSTTCTRASLRRSSAGDALVAARPHQAALAAPRTPSARPRCASSASSNDCNRMVFTGREPLPFADGQSRSFRCSSRRRFCPRKWSPSRPSRRRQVVHAPRCTPGPRRPALQ